MATNIIPFGGGYGIDLGQQYVNTGIRSIEGGFANVPISTPYIPPTPAVTAPVTGVNPTETQYELYGHPIPINVLGRGRIGMDIISGPWTDSGTASFILSAGVPADPTGTRILKEIAFDSEVVWTGTLSGAGTPDSSGFTVDPFTVRFYDGKNTQPADTLETTHFGTDAVAYRPQILLAFDNLPLANTKFNRIPYVSIVIEDSSGTDVNMGEAFERLAYSDFLGFTSDEFETVGITDALVDGGMIIAEDVDFLSLIQRYARMYPTWDILQTDKLRIVDRGDDVEADIILDTTALMGDINTTRQGVETSTKELELSTIDPDADYSIVPSKAQIPRWPVPVTPATGIDRVYLPSIMDAHTRAAVVTLAKYYEEETRKSISGRAMAYGCQMEPGDLVAIANISDDFYNEIFKIKETTHGADFTVEFTGVSMLRCLPGDSGVVTPPVTGTGWNPLDKSSQIALSNANLTATDTDVSGHSAYATRAVTSKTSGKWYFEVTAGIEWNVADAPSGVGLATSAQALDGSNTHALMAYGGDRSIWKEGSYTFQIMSNIQINNGDTFCWAVDLDNMRAWVRRNGGLWNNSAANDPATTAFGISISSLFGSNACYPILSLGTAGKTATANFGDTSMTYTVPAGFTAGWPA